MTLGITTSNAHLDVLDIGGSPSSEEINWNLFLNWNNHNKPDFAGRYFLCQPYKAKDCNGADLVVPAAYMWSHYEADGILPDAQPSFIIPIQQGNIIRQSAEGDLGSQYGAEDAIGLINYIQSCINVGELIIENQIRVYLDISDGSKITPQYWSSWSAAIHDMMISNREQTVKNWPALPCICCKFVEINGKYYPEKNVQDCLDMSADFALDKQTLCQGFWARVTDKVEYHVPDPLLDWSIFGLCTQVQGPKQKKSPAGGQERLKVTIPITLWRYKDIENVCRDGEPQWDRLTLDAFHDDNQCASKTTLTVKQYWNVNNTPDIFGIDTVKDLSQVINSKQIIKCLSETNMNISELPLLDSDATDMDLKGKTSFAIRYYSTSRGSINKSAKDLSFEEAKAISSAGVLNVSCWQKNVYDPPECGCNVAFFHVPPSLIKAGQGVVDARDAFTYAATKIRQPPYTPVYFAIDAIVGDKEGQTYDAKDDAGNFIKDRNGNAVKVIIPSVAQIRTYFQDVAKGYLQYIDDMKENYVPYYIGVYGPRNVLDDIHKQGLASYYWQIVWKQGRYPWPHNNIWQVLLADTRPGFWNNNENATLEHCAGQMSVDLDVSWRDPGGWKVR